MREKGSRLAGFTKSCSHRSPNRACGASRTSCCASGLGCWREATPMASSKCSGVCSPLPRHRRRDEEAVRVLAEPDRDSRTKDNEGASDRTVRWRVADLNYLKYRKQAQAKEGSRAPYYREYRAKQRAAVSPNRWGATGSRARMTTDSGQAPPPTLRSGTRRHSKC